MHRQAQGNRTARQNAPQNRNRNIQRNQVPLNPAHPIVTNNNAPPAAPNAPGDPAPQPPAGPAALNQLPRIGYARSARFWRPRLAPHTNAHEYYKARWRVDPESPKAAIINCHSLQAMERSCAIVESLAYMYDQGLRNVLNVYADMRETKFNTTFNKQRLPQESEMKIIRYCPNVVPKDHTRHPTSHPWHTLIGEADSILFVDIYHQHHTSTMNFDPQYVADCLLQIPGGHHRASAYWIGRKFYGDCGVVPEPFEGKSYAEGAWIRENDKILYRASPYESFEYTHDPCDWIWSGRSCPIDGGDKGTFYLNWTEVRVNGSMHVIHFNLSLTGGLIANSPLYPFEKNFIDLPVPASVGWRGWLQSKVSQSWGLALGINETVRVFKPLLEGPLAHNVLKRKVQYNLTAITNRLLSSIMMKDCAVFYACFKRLSPADDLHRIALAVQVYNIDTNTQNLVANAAQNGAIQAVYNRTLNETGAAPSSDAYSWYTTVVPATACVVAGAYLFYKYRRLQRPGFFASIVHTFRDSKATESTRTPSLSATLIAHHLRAGDDMKDIILMVLSQVRWRQLISNYLLSCIISPFGEEAVKRWGNYLQPKNKMLLDTTHAIFRHALPVGEFLLSVYNNPDVVNIIMRSFVLALHYRWTDLPFWQGVLEHSVWNQTALGFQILTDDAQFNYYLGFASIFNLFHKETPSERYQRYASYAAKRLVSEARVLTKKVVVTASAIKNVIRPAPPTFVSRLLGLSSLAAKVTLVGACAYMVYQKLKPTPEPKRDEYQQWRETYYQEDWNSIPEPDMSVPKFVAPVTTWTVPMSLTSSVPTRPEPGYEIRGMKVKGPWLPDIAGPQQYFYHLLPTCVPTYVAQKTYANLNAAVSARVLVLTPSLPQQQLRAWDRLRHDSPFFQMFLQSALEIPDTQDGDSWNDIVDEWISHMNKPLARKRYTRIVQDIRQNGVPFQTPICTPIFVKNNEALMQCKDGRMALKPRIICNVNPLFSAFVGPHIYTMQKQLSTTIFPVRQGIGKEFQYGDIYFRLTVHYAGASLDSDLTLWAANVLQRDLVPVGQYGLSIMVSGDDSLVAVYTPTSFKIIEGDASMFDITQSSGPLLHEAHINVALGVPQYIATAIYDETHAPMALYPANHPDLDPMYIDRKECPTRPSGGTNTSTGNGCIMAQTWIAVMVPFLGSHYTLEDVEAAFISYGFKMKLKIFNDTLNGPTFLKGMWYPTMAHGNVWAPLPSRFLKVGKSIVNPVELYGEPDKVAACGMYLHDVASSFSTYMRIPLMDAFVDTFKKGDVINIRKYEYQDPTNPFRIQGSGQYCNAVITDDAYVMLEERYGIDKSQFQEATIQILESTPLTFLSHPTYVALWKVDYA